MPRLRCVEESFRCRCGPLLPAPHEICQCFAFEVQNANQDYPQLQMHKLKTDTAIQWTHQFGLQCVYIAGMLLSAHDGCGPKTLLRAFHSVDCRAKHRTTAVKISQGDKKLWFRFSGMSKGKGLHEPCRPPGWRSWTAAAGGGCWRPEAGSAHQGKACLSHAK